MKKHLIKVPAVLLCISLTVSCFSAFFFARDNTSVAFTDIPVIYVGGQGDAISITNPGASKERIYPVDISAEYILSQTEKNFPHFAQALLTKNYDLIAEDISETMQPYFEKLALDENGEPKNGSMCEWQWSYQSINVKKINGKYPLMRFRFNYDWRLDPCTLAEDLHEYIEAVCKKTGSNKVSILGRCLGTNIVAAYMQKYDAEHIKDCIFYCPAINGCMASNAMFTVDLDFDSDCIDRYVRDLQIAEDEDLDTLIKSLVSLLNKTGGLNLTVSDAQMFYNKILKGIMPGIMKDTFATFPGMWSMVSERYYEQARNTIIADDTEGKYDNFKKIIDNYHYNVQLKAPEYLKKFKDSGIDVSVICKYGYAAIPFMEDSDELSDNTATLSDSSLGATACKFGETLSDAYIEEAVSKGNGKYISPDKQIDASTCLFPDNTWIIKDIVHTDFPDSIDLLMEAIINNDGFDVNIDPSYPQYLVYDKKTEKIVPMTEKNMNTEGRYKKSFLRTVWDFLVSLWNLIVKVIKK